MDLINVQYMEPWWRRQLELPVEKVIKLDMRQRIHTDMGNFVRDLHYRSHLEKHFGRELYMDYPHEGAVHLLYFTGTVESIMDFVRKMRKERNFGYTANRGRDEFLDLLVRRVYETAF